MSGGDIWTLLASKCMNLSLRVVSILLLAYFRPSRGICLGLSASNVEHIL